MSFGRWGDSFPGRNETEQERISRAWEGNQERAGLPRARPSLVATFPLFPALLRESRAKPGAPLGVWWVPLGGPRGVGGILGEFGRSSVLGKGKARRGARQREFQERLPVGIGCTQRDQAAKSRSQMDPGCFPGEAG